MFDINHPISMMNLALPGAVWLDAISNATTFLKLSSKSCDDSLCQC